MAFLWTKPIWKICSSRNRVRPAKVVKTLLTKYNLSRVKKHVHRFIVLRIARCRSGGKQTYSAHSACSQRLSQPRAAAAKIVIMNLHSARFPLTPANSTLIWGEGEKKIRSIESLPPGEFENRACCRAHRARTKRAEGRTYEPAKNWLIYNAARGIP